MPYMQCIPEFMSKQRGTKGLPNDYMIVWNTYERYRVNCDKANKLIQNIDSDSQNYRVWFQIWPISWRLEDLTTVYLPLFSTNIPPSFESFLLLLTISFTININYVVWFSHRFHQWSHDNGSEQQAAAAPAAKMRTMNISHLNNLPFTNINWHDQKAATDKTIN